MRTNIVLDDDLVRKAMKATGLGTKRAVVEEGLRLLVKVNAQTGIRRLRGRSGGRETSTICGKAASPRGEPWSSWTRLYGWTIPRPADAAHGRLHLELEDNLSGSEI